MFTDPLLVVGFVQLFEMIVLPVIVTMVAKFPPGIENQVIPKAAEDADFQAAGLYRVPEGAGCGLYGETGSAEGERGDIVFRCQLLIGWRQGGTQCDDIRVIARTGPEVQHKIVFLNN